MREDIKNEVNDVRTATENPKGKKSRGPIIAIIVGVLIAAIAIGFAAFYFNSATYKASKAIKLGDKYLSELDYEMALASYREAKNLVPDKEEIQTQISAGVSVIVNEAVSKGTAGEFEKELELANLVLEYFPDDEGATTAAAHAKKEIEILKAKEEKEREIQENLDAFVEYVNDNSEDDILDYIDSADFDKIAEIVDETNPVVVDGDPKVEIGFANGAYYIKHIYADGTVKIYCSAANTYSIYAGSESSGNLEIWLKSEGRDSSVAASGALEGGLITGSATFTAPDSTSGSVGVNAGQVKVAYIEEETVYLTEVIDSYALIAANYGSSGEVIDGYMLGVPCMGATDNILKVDTVCEDTEPPVIECSLKVGGLYWIEDIPSYQFYPFMAGISAHDNIDGDITQNIKYTSTKSEDKMWDDYDIILSYTNTIVYTVTDAAGNKAKLTVVSEVYEYYCDWPAYRVISIKRD